MDMYMNGTCVSFRQRQPYDRAYVQITKGTFGECSSNVGMVTARDTVGVSRTVLSSNCTSIGSILHELGHILGRYHEHSRLDRDSYVEILYQNIYAPAISNFFIYFDTYTTVPYDYNSIMHYDSRAYSTNGLDTIRSLNTSTPSVLWPLSQTVLGQRLYLTELDYANINFMYNCSAVHAVSVTPKVSTTTLVILATRPFHPCGAVAFDTSAVDLSTTPVPFTQGLVLTSFPLAPAVQTPVYTTTLKVTLPNRTFTGGVYSFNSQCICQIWCMYKVLLYFFIVFWY